MLKLRNRQNAMPKMLFGMVAGLGFLILVGLGSVGGFMLFDRINPPPLDKLTDLSVEVVDRDGALLRAYTNKAGQWRLGADLDGVDAEFIDILLTYEDKRFWDHAGVDLRAILRASWQLLSNGRIISGASTISMQLARLLEPREKRSFKAKFWQMLRALQLEERMSKREILTAYLTLAPYGGNLEGIRAASLAYFAKEPKELSLAQAALLVALPQSPEARRPDISPKRALAARNTVLERMAIAGLMPESEVTRASAQPLEAVRHTMPQLAAHVADRLYSQSSLQRKHQTTLDRDLQEKMEQVLLDATGKLAPDLSAALILADGKSGAILAEVGSADYLSAARSGWIDMTRKQRSPGSALKPFIYGLAFEEGLIRAQTQITDSPVDFGGYRPKNFDMGYQGDVSIHDALLLSLNVPAVALLDAVGPARLMERLKRGDVSVKLLEGSDVGLAIGLGGLGITLKDLTQLYTSFVNDGRIKRLHDQPLSPSAREIVRAPVLDRNASWHVGNILKDATPPRGTGTLPIAYKTGTSYGYRDAWSVGFEGRYVIGVWVGKPDNSAVPGITGRSTAAPILYDAFARSGLTLTPFPKAPSGTQEQAFVDLPPTLKHFRISNLWSTPSLVPEAAPQISYPPDGARIELTPTAQGKQMPLVVKLQNGRPPFRWLGNGRVFAANGRKRRINWMPDGQGQSTLTVIDAAGRADSVSVFLQVPSETP
ncbi:penicillin-binding protein 1C [Cohaesibacter marisflavi]|uniref:penicillin-binding protein 1C n=1 Tax=Cohaesibacter marisflavi TaxID=655353 RepID=UPI0029C68A49|nr:penicillin-binding protein 1C [Cohaesibacter marisflavi]